VTVYVDHENKYMGMANCIMCEKELHIGAEIVTGMVTVYMSGPLPINIFQMMINNKNTSINDVRYSRVWIDPLEQNNSGHVDGHMFSFCTECFNKLDIKNTHDKIRFYPIGFYEGDEEKQTWFTLKSQEK